MAFCYLPSECFALMVLGLVVLFTAITDLKSQRIPNKITFPAIIIGMVFNTWFNGFDGLIFSFQGMCLGIALFIVPYVIGKMGAGDAKLMGAVGAFLGSKGVIIAFFYIGIAGGIYALLLILFHRQQFNGFFMEQYHNLVSFILTRTFDGGNSVKASSRPCLCYGLAIAAGTWLYIGLALFGANQLVPL